MSLNPAQFNKLEISYEKVLSRLGYAYGKTKLDAITADIIKEEINNVYRLINAKQVISFAAIQISGENQINLEPGLLIKSKKIFELLQGCSTAYGFAITIGSGVEHKRDLYLKEKETARALILDAVGSVAAEELAETTQKQIAEELKISGMIITKRFSPGYGDWDLPQQKNFLQWLGASNIGIKLNDNFQMIPEKSISAVLGAKKP